MQHLKKQKIWICTLILMLFFMGSLTGCDAKSSYFAKSDNSSGLWGRMRKNFHITKTNAEPNSHPRVQKYVKHFTQSDKRMQQVSAQAHPYLYYIVEQLEKRNMPAELALLPMIESNFKPQATSHKGAAGLWQFIPGTGRLYGLKQDSWYDGRRDVKASTKAALDYLAYLHREFDENWMLALAAYNAGEGTVHRAIKRNIRAGKPTTYWDLNLPKETKEYVPKFLALAQVIHNPAKHDVSLHPIADKPYFVPVNPGKALNLQQAAKLADVNISELKRLNPGYRKNSTHPKGPQELLIPIANVPTFVNNGVKSGFWTAQKPGLLPATLDLK